MDENVLKLLLGGIGIAGVLLGAAVTAAANAYAAKQKVKELNLIYRQKLQDNYHENARRVSAEVYIPIAIALTNLTKSYEEFRSQVNFDNKEVPATAKTAFDVQCSSFLAVIDDLMDRGADAYLTIELDQTLQTFTGFVGRSRTAEDVKKKIVIESNISFVPMKMRLPAVSTISTGEKWLLRIPNVSLNIAGIGLRYNEQILAAPLESREFEVRFQADALAVKSLIKEVTLGSRSGPN
jgi:hypothetical protein